MPRSSSTRGRVESMFRKMYLVRVRIDSSVNSIPNKAFFKHIKLIKVELSEGLVEIGKASFACCEHSITKIIIPNSLSRINDYAFFGSLRTPIRLHDGVESIGRGAIVHCNFTNFRVPPLITTISDGMLSGCKSMYSLEMSANVTEIGNAALTGIGKEAFGHCYSLRNVANHQMLF